jgi:hypothetical protein
VNRYNLFVLTGSEGAVHAVNFQLQAKNNRFKGLVLTGAPGRFVIGEMDIDTTGKPDDPQRLSGILHFLTREFVLAMEDGGIPAFERMYDNGKKDILNDGEYCTGFGQREELCRNAGFKNVEVSPVKGFAWFKVLVTTKEEAAG